MWGSHGQQGGVVKVTTDEVGITITGRWPLQPHVGVIIATTGGVVMATTKGMCIAITSGEIITTTEGWSFQP